MPTAGNKPDAGKTSSADAHGTTPRAPHEHDESSDSGTSEPRDVMRQAREDIESGKTATDRSEATDAAYRRQRSPDPDKTPAPRR